MSRALLLAGFLAALAAVPAHAQVEVMSLPAPDAFSIAGRETGLPPTLWAGTSMETVRAVLPLIAAKPLSPAAAALARRVLAAGAAGPEGASADPDLAGARANALIALGDVASAARILDRAPGLDRSAELSRAAAETALLAGNAQRACAVASALTVSRGETYWLRLRAFCQAEAGQVAQAQLTFDLAQSNARDAAYGRLMSAKLLGAAPGAASLRDGLDLALSRSLDLDLSAAKPSPAVASALAGAPPAEPVFDVSAIDGATGGLAASLPSGPPPPGALSALIAVAAEADPKSRARIQAAALLISAFSPDLPAADRARVAAFAVPEGKGAVGRNLALEAAGRGRRMGEAALLALWISADTGAAGPAVADRVRIASALNAAGLASDARAFALEGLAGLK
jgi:hypothetical protein